MKAQSLEEFRKNLCRCFRHLGFDVLELILGILSIEYDETVKIIYCPNLVTYLHEKTILLSS